MISATDAAEALGVGQERARQLARSGELAGSIRGDDGCWRIPLASVEARVAARGRRVAMRPVSAEDSARLTSAVQELTRRYEASSAGQDAIERERDRYRSDAASIREAALRLNAAAQDVYDGVTSLLNALRGQSEALVQLIAPASPAELVWRPTQSEPS
jgi:Helix-turn-helix domain